MALGVYRIPREFKDEDKWFRFFTKTQLLIMGIGVAICALFFLIFGSFGLYRIAIVFSVFVLMVCGILAFFNIPDSRYLYGCGYPVYVILMRLIRKYFMQKKQIYIKRYVKEGSVK